jgi:hypothetical protein
VPAGREGRGQPLGREGLRRLGDRQRAVGHPGSTPGTSVAGNQRWWRAPVTS